LVSRRRRRAAGVVDEFMQTPG